MVGTAPQPKSQTLLFGQGMTLPRAHLFCFFFAFFCCFFFLLLFCVFFVFYLNFLRFLSKSIQFWKSQFGSGTNPFGWPPVHLAGVSLNIARSSSASRVRLGPHFSSLMCPFVFCAGFTTLSRLICCFHVCCIWHFPLSLAAFHLSIFSTYHVASFQLALVPSMCSFICQMCPFSSCICSFYFSSICNVCLFSTCILLSHFFCNCHVCLFQIYMFQIHSCLHCFSICSRCKHPRTSAIRQHTYTYIIYIYIF